MVGAHIIRAFVLSKLVEEGLITISDYTIPPFIPTQESQDFDNVAEGKPYIVYTYTMSSYQGEWWICPETMAMRIYSNDEEDIRILTTYLVDLFKRADWSAADINTWVFAEGTSTEQKFDFKTCQVINAIGPEEYTSPDGRQAGVVVIRYEYTRLLQEDEGTGMLA